MNVFQARFIPGSSQDGQFWGFRGNKKPFFGLYEGGIPAFSGCATKRSRTFRSILLLLLGALILVRVTLSWVVKDLVNRQLAQMSDYQGHVESIGLNLLEGSCQLRGLTLEKKGGTPDQPLLKAPWIGIGLQWKALFQRKVVASLTVKNAELNLIQAPPQEPAGAGTDWAKVLAKALPIKVNSLRLQDATLRYKDPYGDPPVDIQLDRLDLSARNLSTRPQESGANLIVVSASARAMEDGRMYLEARLDPFSPDPSFDYSLVLEELSLSELNPFIRRYVGIDVQSGKLAFYSQAAAAGGKFKGYYKPMVSDLKVMRPHEKLDLRLLKKGVIGTLGWFFADPKGRVATRFEFAGTFKDPHTSLWKALRVLFANAYVRELPPELEEKVRLEDLQKKGAP